MRRGGSRCGWTRRAGGPAIAIAIAIATGAAAGLSSSPARAAPPADARATAADKEATELYVQGSELSARSRCDQALPLLERSYALLESPNTALLLGRCLRDTGSPEEAMLRYEIAIQQARERVARGELRYAATERAARSEHDALRAQMGVLVVRGLLPGDRVELYRLRLEPTHGGITVAVRPGATRLRVVREGGVREIPVNVSAGGESSIEAPPEEIPVTRPAKPAGEPPVRTDETGRPPPAQRRPTPEPSTAWTGPATIAAGTVAIVGLGAFAFFGLRSEAVHSDLEVCTPRCPNDKRRDAERAAREQTYANVGLIVGLAFAAATAALIVVRLSSSQAAARTGTTTLRVGPRGVLFDASF